MRTIVAIAAILLSSSLARGQNGEELLEFNQKRLSTNRRGMVTLGSWALGNMVLSGGLLAAGSQGEARGFHQMNLAWNGVNAIIAGVGYHGSSAGNAQLGLRGSVQELESIKRTLLFNAGLDAAYIAGGFYMRERARRSSVDSDQWHGFGSAVIMNGAFLMAFDLVMYALHSHHGAQKLYPILDKISLTGSSVGFHWDF